MTTCSAACSLATEERPSPGTGSPAPRPRPACCVPPSEPSLLALGRFVSRVPPALLFLASL